MRSSLGIANIEQETAKQVIQNNPSIPEFIKAFGAFGANLTDNQIGDIYHDNDILSLVLAANLIADNRDELSAALRHE